MVSVPGFSEALEEATQESLEQKEPEKHSSSGNKGSSIPVIRSTESSNQTVVESNAGYGTDSSEPALQVSKSAADPDYVEGYEMQKDSVEEKENENESRSISFSGSDIFGILFVVAAVGGVYLGFYRKKM